MTTGLTIRMDEELKRQMNETLASMGLNASTFFVMAAKQLVDRQELLLKVKATSGSVNQAIEQVLLEERAKMLGLFPDDAKAFESDYFDKIRQEIEDGTV
jgi:addiction module RelB/DinJ family antitoxin